MAFHLDDGAEDDRAMADINVTPLVDVMLVLLIIFMITAPMLHQGVEVDLPESAKAEEIPMRIDDPLVLSIRTDGMVWIRDEPVHTDRLVERLGAILATREDKQVFIKGDRNISYGQFIEVVGELKAGNIEHIGLVAEELDPDRRR
ncbi:MAG: ExbD/TolR family protein [Holophagales bacterium]|nr:ExbD/TolR family protein [Holophagales bacterium]